jgi:uncharacterized membrane protein YGL010W
MTPFTQRAKLYSEYHQKRETLYTHVASILLLSLALLILLGFFHLYVPGLFDITLATIGTIALLVYYFVVNWKLALVLTPVFLILLWISHFVSYQGPTSFSLWTFVLIFVLSGIILSVGYFLEGRRPPFYTGLKQLFLEPMFLTAEIFFMIGKMQPLHDAIHNQYVEEVNTLKK